MPKHNTVRLAFAGIGDIAQSHMAKITSGQVRGAQVYALCSRNAENAQNAAEKLGISPKIYQSYNEMLANDGIDGVVICTPQNVHAQMAQKSLDAGKHTLVEKPLGISLGVCHRLAETAQKQQPIVKAGVFFNQRTNPAYVFIKEQLNQNTIGEIIRAGWVCTNNYRSKAYYHAAEWRGVLAKEGGGVLMSQTSHQLDALCWLLGKPNVTAAQCRTVNLPLETENEAAIMLEWPNGGSGHFIASTCEAPGTNRLEICGTKGQIIAENGETVTTRILKQSTADFADTCTEVYGKIPFDETVRTFNSGADGGQHTAILQNFTDAILQNTPLVCPLPEALQSLEVAHAAYILSGRRGLE